MNNKLDIVHQTVIQVNSIAKALIWHTEGFACEIEYQDEGWAILKFANTSLDLPLPAQHPYHLAILIDNLILYGETIPHRNVTSSIYIQDEDKNNIEMLKLTNKGDII